MILQEITERELSVNGVVSLPTRPGASREFGGRSYTPTQLKEAFDRLPRLIAERYNQLLHAIDEGDLAESLMVMKDGVPVTIKAYLEEILLRQETGEEKQLQIEAVQDTISQEQRTQAQTMSEMDAFVRDALDVMDADITYLSIKANMAEENINTLYAIAKDTVVVLETTEDTYSTRQTGGGTSVIDGTPTIVKKIQGNTEAVVTSKNLIDLGSRIGSGVTVGGITVTADNNTLTFTGANTEQSGAFVTIPLALENGKTYTLYQDRNFEPETDPVGILAEIYSADSNTLASTNASNTPAQFTFENGAFLSLIFSCPSETTGNEVNYTISFMLNEGSTALPYEPYKKELFSTEFSGIRSTGKNLIDMETLIDGSISKNGFTVTANNNTLTVSGIPTTSYAAFITFKNPSFLQAGKTYTFYQTTEKTYGGTNPYFGIVGYRLAPDGTSKWLGHTAANPITFTVEAGFNYQFQIVTNYHPVGTPINLVIPFMFCEGSVELPYEPYSYVDYSLEQPIELGEWDFIDVEKQQVVRQTYYIDCTTDSFSLGSSTSASGITQFWVSFPKAPKVYDNQYSQKDIIPNHTYTVGQNSSSKWVFFGRTAQDSLAIFIRNDDVLVFDDYETLNSTATNAAMRALLIETGFQFACKPSEVVSRESITCPSAYTAWNMGSETVLPEGEQVTITQDYYAKAGGNEV